MKTSTRRLRATVAATTMVVVTALGVAVPLLDRGWDAGGLALSEPGHPAGYVDHNHDVCVQHSATAWSSAAATELPSERFVRQADAPCRVVVHPQTPLSSLHHSRAPPSL